MEQKKLNKNNLSQDIFCKLDKELIWGHYKPQLLYAISQRDLFTHNPITFSLMYYDPYKLNNYKDLIYKVNQIVDKDVLINYEASDGKTFSVHRINDKEINLNIISTFVKRSYNEFYTMIENTDVDKITNNESVGIVINCALQVFDVNAKDHRTLSLSYDDKGWNIKFNSNETENYTDQYAKLFLFINDTLISPTDTNYIDYNFNNINTPKDLNWDIQEMIFNDIQGFKSGLSLSEYFLSFFKNNKKRSILKHKKIKDEKVKDATICYLNLSLKKKEKFQLIIHYSHNNPNEIITPESINIYKHMICSTYNTRFHEKFLKNVKNLKPNVLQCAKQSFSNLIGSLSFSYGDIDSVQQERNCNKYYTSILSHIPSRAGFPRPFLWDEGFHTLITVRWSQIISLQIISDWLCTMNENGWIPREQPRGPELKSYIPGLKQDNRETNPPTLMFTILYIKEKNPNLLKVFLGMNNNWDKIKTWFNRWYKTQGVTDNNDNHLDLFKWWGPDPSLNLGSGMDDFPRNSLGYEPWANIDATAWGYFFTESLYELSKFCGENQQFIELLENKKFRILHNLKKYLLDKDDYIYKDKMIQTCDRSFKFSFHLGYPNLMPLIFGIIEDNSTEMNATLNFLSNPDTIWTEYGLASLSKEDYYYGQGSNYWRGPIWININYLVLRSLTKYYSKNINARSIYKKLKENLIHLVLTNWETYGYFFEHYNQNEDGKGKGNKIFNGWTSLITLIIGEDY